MKSRIFKTAICILLVLSILAFPAEKVQAKIYTGVTEDNFKYTLDTEEKVMAFEGEGSFRGYDFSSSVAGGEAWKFASLRMHWVIGEGITRIECMKANFMTSIQLPQSLKIIDEYAFNYCWGLEKIEIPNGVETIKKSAFSNCVTLREVINHSNQTVYLPSHPDFTHKDKYSLPFDYYVDGEPAVTVPPGKTAVGIGKQYRVYLERNGGKLSKADKKKKIYYQIGEPLKLPRLKKKGYIFCGWTAKEKSRYAWYTISNEDSHDIYGSTLNWRGPQTLYAQFTKVSTKKLGKRKLKVGVPMWKYENTDKLEIQYSTNKKFKKHQSVIVKATRVMKIWEFGKKNKNKHYKLTYNRKKEMLFITLSKLKTKKTYYFRFRYSGDLEKPGYEIADEIFWYNTGDWFKKSVKM